MFSKPVSYDIQLPLRLSSRHPAIGDIIARQSRFDLLPKKEHIRTFKVIDDAYYFIVVEDTSSNTGEKYSIDTVYFTGYVYTFRVDSGPLTISSNR